jgi:hypothetical protein
VTVTNSSPASSVSLAPANGATGASLIGAGVGPALTIKNLIAGTNIVISVSGTGDLMISGAAAQVGLDTLTGSGGASIDLSQPDRIILDGADVFYPSMPKAAWAQTNPSNPIAFGLNAVMPIAFQVTPGTVSGFAVTPSNGLTTFDVGGARPARKCQVTYRFSVKTAIVAVGTLRPFVSLNGSTDIPLNHCEYAYSLGVGVTPSTIPMSVSAELLLGPNDTVQLMAGLTGAAQTLTFSAVTCDIQGTLAGA